MRIIEWAIIFVLLSFPFFWVSSLRADNRMQTVVLEQRYNAVLRTAAQDGAAVLGGNELPRYEAGYPSGKFFRVDQEAGLEALLHTLYVNFHVEDDPVGQRTLLTYIPAIAVIDYDGYYLYGAQDWVEDNEANNEGKNEGRISYGWYPKKPYVYTDAAGLGYSFTLDGGFTVFDRSAGTFQSSRYEDIADENIGDEDITNEDVVDEDIADEDVVDEIAGNEGKLFSNKEQLEAVRRTAIVQSIERDLQDLIARHNELAAQIGVNYVFTLPVIGGEDWNNTIDDSGMLVFLQGIPIGDRYYNNFAFGGGRLQKREPVFGGVNRQTGVKYAYPEGCMGDYKTEETFANEREAAAKGYFAAECGRFGR